MQERSPEEASDSSQSTQLPFRDQRLAEKAALSVEGFQPKQKQIQKQELARRSPSALQRDPEASNKGKASAKKGVRFNLEPQSNLRDTAKTYSRQPTDDVAEPSQVPLQNQTEDAIHKRIKREESEAASADGSPAQGSSIESDSQPAVLVLDIEDPDSVLDVEVELPRSSGVQTLCLPSFTHNLAPPSCIFYPFLTHWLITLGRQLEKLLMLTPTRKFIFLKIYCAQS